MTKPRSFTVRVPYEMYLEICDLAQQDKQKLNAKVTELLKLGMGEFIRVDDRLRSMLLNMENTNDGK